MTVCLSPGDQIESRCTRCHDITGHVIIVIVGGEILKVECRACKSIHKYYPPKQAKISLKKIQDGSTTDKQKRITSKQNVTQCVTSSLSKKAQRTMEESEERWQQAMNSSFGSSKPYDMAATFTVGDIIVHPKFGEGVVQELQHPNKVQVLFCDGLKLLRCML